MSELQYGDWFGSYATQAAAKRYLTMVWTGPKVDDSAMWTGETREHEGRWQVRLATPPTRGSLADECERIYERDGQFSVHAFIRQNHPNVAWAYCGPCEIESPVAPRGENTACLVCGSVIKNADPEDKEN